MNDKLKPYPFDAWIDREVDTGVTYFNNLVAGLGPWSDKREKHIRNQMRLAFEAGINTRHAVRPAVKALDWRIREDHFRADTPSGVYTVGDAGGGLAIVRLADGCSLRCTFDEAKNVCEWHYLSCLEDTPADPWLPIEDMPDDWARVILAHEDYRKALYGYFHGLDKKWVYENGFSIPRPERLTHWMPLPTPQTQEKDDG